MKLSIITINYNNKDGLLRTINSVISQSFSNYEWIVIDGGSKDGSKDLIESNSDLFSYWVSEPDNGIYHAMNKGIKHAQGDWLYFLNSGDCLYCNTTLEQVFKSEYIEDVVYGDRVCKVEGKETVSHYTSNVSLSYFLHNPICHQATFFRKVLFSESLYCEDYRIASDWAYCIDLVLKGAKFHHINQVIVNYDNTGISSHFGSDQLAEMERVKQEHIPYHLKQDIEKMEKWDFVSRRRSLSILYNKFYKICKIIDKFLTNIEQKTR